MFVGPDFERGDTGLGRGGLAHDEDGDGGDGAKLFQNGQLFRADGVKRKQNEGGTVPAKIFEGTVEQLDVSELDDINTKAAHDALHISDGRPREVDKTTRYGGRLCWLRLRFLAVRLVHGAPHRMRL